ncbi:acyltransferase [Cloacibacterium sp.]|uniref:acyltransferase n=1 Tax=Cloacibacterium sp. TaxID=1913682 RepID=UPI0039E3DE18
MINIIINKIKKIIFRISNEELSVQANLKTGMKVGKNVYGLVNCTIDHGHCWLIEIGNNVVFAPQVYLLAHDTSTKKSTGYVRVGKLEIGDNCFIGARAFIMPGVKLGKNCIVGAASVVTKSFPDNSVIAGNPAKFICTVEEYEKKNKRQIEEFPLFSEEYTLGSITEDKKQKMIDKIEKFGFVK